MTGGRQFQPAADGCAMERGDDRHMAVTDGGEGGMPGARMMKRFLRVPRTMLGEVETGAETWAVAEDQHRLCLGLCARHAIGQRSEQPVVDGVSLLRPV